MSDCTFAGNKGCLLAVEFDSDVTAFGCLVYSNAYADAAIIVDHSSLALINCTIADNLCSTGAILAYRGQVPVAVRNCILWNNSTKGSEIGGGTAVSVINSCVKGGYSGLSVITKDPLFVAPGKDYRLAPGSPCINAGENRRWMAAGSDLDGFPRVSDGVVDLGAYESPSQNSRAQQVTKRPDKNRFVMEAAAARDVLDAIVLPDVDFRQAPLDVALKSMEKASRASRTGYGGGEICLRLGPEFRNMPLVSLSATNVSMRTAIERVVAQAGLYYEYKEYKADNPNDRRPERVVAVGSRKHAGRLIPRDDPEVNNAQAQLAFEVFAIPQKQCGPIEEVLPVIDWKNDRTANEKSCSPEYRTAMVRAVGAFSHVAQGRKPVKSKSGWYPNGKESIEREPDRPTPSKPETFVVQTVPEADPITGRCRLMVSIAVWLSHEARRSFQEDMTYFNFFSDLQKNESAIALAKSPDDKLNAYVIKITYTGFRTKGGGSAQGTGLRTGTHP